MNNFATWIEGKLSGPMTKLSNQRHLLAIRDGVISGLPFIIFGSFFLIFATPPLPESWAVTQWATEHAEQILIPYRMTMFIMSLYIVFGIGYNLAKSYDLDPLSAAQLSTAAFLLTIAPTMDKELGFVLPMTNLGGHGLFVAMFVAIFSVETYRLCKNKNITIKMPPQVPPSVSRSFESLIPVVIVLGAMSVITVVFQLDLHTLVDKIVGPLVFAGDTLPGVLVPVFLTTFFWAFGIHGMSIVGTIDIPLWEVYLAKNAEAHAAGEPLPHIAPETFFQWFVWIGGAGATLGLVICILLFAKSQFLKKFGKAVSIPSLFNINEPVIFGLPIVLNPIMVIPFIIIPIVLTIITYFATLLGLVNATSVMAPWTLPAPIGAYLATGGDWRAIVLVLINITVSVIIYFPFFKMYDRKMVLEESGETKEEIEHDMEK
ncbi:PTS sugar transporter subunit IIC [Mammaliicoccus fleurettii]|uniref:PTS sugar transporter subunit IIC n=1 Tax=Mammaliicoccus fleurettii TaxID=150056 RepID=UPI001AAD7B03|nr:PTS sugar transporter subunit IIC [Mammaliicoccus fleurettii]MBO3061687.1 PTS sugar transporter subunit IIC [Mammaliicoccus fleurettii]